MNSTIAWSSQLATTYNFAAIPRISATIGLDFQPLLRPLGRLMRKQDTVQRSENFIKGKIGENIILRLLRDLGFDVYHNGYEITHPAFLALMRKKRLDGGQLKKYRTRADLTVLKESDGGKKSQFFEAEIKYSSSGHVEELA